MNNNRFSNQQWADDFFDRLYLEKMKHTKVAAKMEDIVSLQQEAEELDSLPHVDFSIIREFRTFLGPIMRNINNISRVYKMGVRGQNVKEEAMALRDDLNNFGKLKEIVAATIGILERKIPDIEMRGDMNSIRAINQIIGMLRSIQTMNFSPEEIRVFNNLALGQHTSDLSYAEEVNAKRMETFLKGAIYSSKNPSDVSRKVIREILQNAVDATLRVQKNGYVPTVYVNVSSYGHSWEKDSFMDVTIADNGSGMDLATLSNNFYVYFQSGKETEEGAAGGFGIAKAIIQETPQEGWSLETNDIGTSSFHKNMYMGTKLQNSYQHPKLEVSRQGTQINLYHIPAIDTATIRGLCSKYAMSNVQIYFNDDLVEPVFDFGNMQKVGEDGQGIISAVSSNAVEEELAQNIINDKKDMLFNKNIGGFQWNFKGEDGQDKYIVVSFYLSKVKDGFGQFYVRLNGQYQFESGYNNQCNIICEIQTNTRPNEDEYPMDPGRENLRSPIKETVFTAKMALEEVIRDITDNEVFKEGLNIYIYNKDKEPISNISSGERKNERRSRFLQSMENNIAAGSSLFAQKEIDSSSASEALQEMARNSEEMTQRQRAMLDSVAEALQSEKNVFDSDDLMNDVMDMLDTPCEVTVQKNFVSDSIAHEDIGLTTSMAIVWQKVLKIILRGSQPFVRGQIYEFIPGLVYSDRAIALYSPKNPKIGRDYATISVNPLFIASLVQPDLFEKYLVEDSSMGMEEDRGSIAKDETPINRLSVFLFHEAIHEITHLLFPELYGNSFDKFHAWISKLENVNHFNFNQIRAEVKRYMPQLKRDADKLIRRIKKDKKRA